MQGGLAPCPHFPQGGAVYPIPPGLANASAHDLDQACPLSYPLWFPQGWFLKKKKKVPFISLWYLWIEPPHPGSGTVLGAGRER